MKKAFTLLELLIVVIIIGFLMAAMGKMFSYRDVDRINFDTCYTKSYSLIDSFFQQALSQKMVRTGNTLTGVNLYQIKFYSDKIEFVYSGAGVINTIKLSGTGEDDKNKCYTPTYHTFLTGTNLAVNIKPGLQVDPALEGLSAMTLYTGNNFQNKLPSSQTGYVIFEYCDTPLNYHCLQKYKLEIDPRSYLFKSYFCVKVDTNNGKCLKRSR